MPCYAIDSQRDLDLLPELTLKPMPPFLQHRQANMRKMKVKSPEKETATTTREEDQESSLKGVPSVGR